MIGYLNAFGKLCISVPLAMIFLLPLLAYSDSELPANVDPRPSEPDLEQLISILRSTPENGWVRVNNNQFQDVWTPTGLLVSTNKRRQTGLKQARPITAGMLLIYYLLYSVSWQ